MKSVAPYTLGVDGSGSITDQNGKVFDIRAYSRMKYGVKTDMQRFADDVFDEIMAEAPELISGDMPPAFLTSYKAVAPPSTSLGRLVLDRINRERFGLGLRPGEMVQIYRPKDYIEEYAALPEAERKRLLDEQGENTLRGRNIDGFVPVIFDDIYVTGVIAKMMRQVVKDRKDGYMVFVATCDETLAQNPQAESLLNASDITKPGDLLPYIERGDFIFTRRFLKMLLKTDTRELGKIVPRLHDGLREQISRGIIDTDSELGNLFPEACRVLILPVQRTH